MYSTPSRRGARPSSPRAGAGGGARSSRISVRYFTWSRRVRVRVVEEGQLARRRGSRRRAAAGGAARSGGAVRTCAALLPRAGALRASAPARCSSWIARVCSRPSSTVSTRQRLSSSSSISIAVVVRKIITGPFDAVLVRHELARARVLAGRGDRQLALALQELQRVARALGALLLDDGEDLVLQVLSRPCRRGDCPVIAEYFTRSSSGTKASTASISDDLPARRADWMIDGERLLELARDGGEVADELVRAPRPRRRRPRSRRGCGRGGRGSRSSASAASRSASRHRDGAGAFGSSALRMRSSCSSSSFEQHLAEVALDRRRSSRPARRAACFAKAARCRAE